MRLVKVGLLVAALGFCGSWCQAGEAKPGSNQVVPPAAEAAPGGGQVDQGIGGTLQVPAVGTATITVTAAAVPAAGPVPGGCMSIDEKGVKTFQNEEFGRKVKIVDDPKKGIKIECTTKKGEDETKKYEAKDAAELEKKYPEAFKLYQQHIGNQAVAGAAGGGVIVQGGALQLVPAMPAVPLQGAIQGQGMIVVGPGGPGSDVLPIEAATGMMEQVAKDLQTAMKSDTWKNATKKEKAAVKKQAAELKSRLEDLQKQFEEK